jgi:hypothetical protein
LCRKVRKVGRTENHNTGLELTLATDPETLVHDTVVPSVVSAFPAFPDNEGSAVCVFAMV